MVYMICISTPYEKEDTEAENFKDTMGEIIRDNPDYEWREFTPNQGWKILEKPETVKERLRNLKKLGIK